MKKKDLKAGLYFNEDLTKVRSELLFKARKLFTAERLFGAWFFGGSIYVRDAKMKNMKSNLWMKLRDLLVMSQQNVPDALAVTLIKWKFNFCR